MSESLVSELVNATASSLELASRLERQPLPLSLRGDDGDEATRPPRGATPTPAPRPTRTPGGRRGGHGYLSIPRSGSAGQVRPGGRTGDRRGCSGNEDAVSAEGGPDRAAAAGRPVSDRRRGLMAPVVWRVGPITPRDGGRWRRTSWRVAGVFGAGCEQEARRRVRTRAGRFRLRGGGESGLAVLRHRARIKRDVVNATDAIGAAIRAARAASIGPT